MLGVGDRAVLCLALHQNCAPCFVLSDLCIPALPHSPLGNMEQEAHYPQELWLFLSSGIALPLWPFSQGELEAGGGI